MNADTDILREAASRLEPDVDRLVTGATARGLALRRRRRVGTALAGVAAVAVVAAGVGIASSATDPEVRGDGADVAADPSDTTSPIPPEDVKPDQPLPSPPAGAPDPSVRAKEIPGLVTALYPGEITDAPKSTGRIMNGGESFQVAHFRWNGFLVSVGGMSAGGGEPMTRCRESAGDGATCTRRPDGSALLTWQQTGPAVDGGVTGRGVSLYVPGWDIFATAYNAAEGKDSPVLADEPPFAFEQLQTIVDDPAWFD